MKKKTSLVDAFVFNTAKKNVDKVSKKTDPIQTLSKQDSDPIQTPSYHDNPPIITPSRPHLDLIQTPSKKQTPSKPHPDPIKIEVRLSLNQFHVYNFLKKNGDEGTFTKAFIQKNTGIPYGTVKGSVRKLKNLGILTTKHDRTAKIIEYVINNKIKVKTDLIQTPFRPNPDPIQTGFRPDPDPTPNNSSSSSLYKETTTKSDFFSNPEMGYWEQKKLKPKQIESWMKELNISLEDMIQSLCHCRFEMVDMGLEESKPIKDVFNWFYKRIKKTGFYHAPKEYKSFEDQAIEREQKRLKDAQDRANKLKSIREAQSQVEMDEKFEEMMTDSECELYKKCYEQLNNTQKKKPKGMGFEISMRSAFEKMDE